MFAIGKTKLRKLCAADVTRKGIDAKLFFDRKEGNNYAALLSVEDGFLLALCTTSHGVCSQFVYKKYIEPR